MMRKCWKTRHQRRRGADAHVEIAARRVDITPLVPPRLARMSARPYASTLKQCWAGSISAWQISTGSISARQTRSVLGDVRLADLVQHFRQPSVVARFVEKMRCAERDGGILVFGQVVVGEHDDPRLHLRGGKRPHHPE